LRRPATGPAGQDRLIEAPDSDCGAKAVIELITNPALIAILVFIVAIFVLNIVEFGRPD
jgi:ribose/xylose/arabinose/galactoside ABC-type transport system permease subunit